MTGAGRRLGRRHSPSSPVRRRVAAEPPLFHAGDGVEYGVQLREGHCAVDPKKIPYGSKVVFYDAECVAVDTGPDVVNRKAARICARSAAEQNAIVVDRFFDAKQDALAWAQANPHFMIVKIRTSSTETTY